MKKIMPNKNNIDIDKHEKEILDDFEKGHFVSIPHVEEKMRMARNAAKNFMKRDKRVNIRISEADLNMARKLAAEEGLPYQTLLASVIHKFISGRLINAH